MEAVFFALIFFFTVVGFATFYVQRGIGNMAEPMRQFGLFPVSYTHLTLPTTEAV